MRLLSLCLVVAAAGCTTTPPPPPSSAAREEPCGDPAAYAGGTTLPLDGGGKLWFRVAGKAAGPALLIVHGGPGSNSYNFEKAGGPALEQQLRVVYLDQRGAGRSAVRGATPALGMAPTVEDLERVRRHLGVETMVLLGHSFGGAVALEYQRRYPRQVAGLILAETSTDLGAALAHQIEFAAGIAAQRFPGQEALTALAADTTRTSFERLGELYAAVGRIPLQREIAFASERGQQALEAWDAQNAFRCVTGVVQAYAAEGWLGAKPELQRKLEAPAVVFGGRRSEIIGQQNLEQSARIWGAPVVWFEHSGHFPNIEEPEAFAREVLRFVHALPGN